jgi:hypothetical protein
MSYILEALKKLENSRKPAGALTLSASEARRPQASKARRLLPYLVLVALLLNGTALLWWIAPWRPAGRAHPVMSPAVREAGPEAREASGLPDSGKKNRVLTGAHEPEENSRPQAGQSAVPGQASPAAKPRGSIRNPGREPAAQMSAKPATGGETIKSDGPPRETAHTLPGLKMSLHYYVPDPKSRFVRINEKNLREGDIMSEGPRVEKITEAGVVMSFEGKRFQIGINDEH